MGQEGRCYSSTSKEQKAKSGDKRTGGRARREPGLPGAAAGWFCRCQSLPPAEWAPLAAGPPPPPPSASWPAPSWQSCPQSPAASALCAHGIEIYLSRCKACPASRIVLLDSAYCMSPPSATEGVINGHGWMTCDYTHICVRQQGYMMMMTMCGAV